ncbi:MAG: carbohydrate kinase family protein [Spirochaetales bacterium]|jgi:hypothetical protein|nr:carbohydrate kinase family protein [Spirochaetales bacterium]
MKGALEKLRAQEIPQKRIVAGFDGFVDTIAKPLKRAGSSNVYFNGIGEFGAYIAGQAHKSASIELEILDHRMGGNMPNFIRGMAALGCSGKEGFRLSCIGMLGEGEIDPVFKDLPGDHYSFAPPGNATALEFADGKIFLAPRCVLSGPPAINAFVDVLKEADLIACLNWAELSFTTALWRDLQKNCAALFPDGKGPLFFFDLSDFSRRDDREIREILSIMGGFSTLGTTALSLNRNEAALLAERILPAEALMKEYGIHEVIIHSHDDARLFCGENPRGFCVPVKPVIPVISTGAGDHFNAAYSFAAMMGLEAEERLEFAVLCAGIYTARGKSPHLTDLI